MGKVRNRHSLATLAQTFVCSLGVLGCGLSLVGAPPGRPSSAVPGLGRPCGTSAGRPVVDQVLVIWEENHNYGNVIGNRQAPELNRLARQCGLATAYSSTTHPSLPNYLEMTSGLSYTGWPWVTDCDAYSTCTTSAPSIFSELSSSGRQWRSYAEDMGQNCQHQSSGLYAARHNPAVYYNAVYRDCRAWDQPMGTPTKGLLHDALAAGPTVPLVTVSPDVEDDMHSGSVAQADQWLGRWLPQMVASPAYRTGHMAVIVAWDEGSGSGNYPSHVPLIVMSASTPSGARSAAPYNDFSVLRTLGQLVGAPAPGRAAHAVSLVGAFNL